MEKDASIQELLVKLTSLVEPGAFEIVDYWDADLFAIGLARPGESSVLAYVSTREAPGRYTVHLELMPSEDSGLPYTPGDVHEGLDWNALVTVVGAHLGWPNV